MFNETGNRFWHVPCICSGKTTHSAAPVIALPSQGIKDGDGPAGFWTEQVNGRFIDYTTKALTVKEERDAE